MSKQRLRLRQVDEVALVDKGDNPTAAVVIHKRAPDSAGNTAVGKATMKTEGGEEFPASAYAYVPDPEKPSTWKLRLWESPEKKVTAKQVGMAVAALSPGGFRGSRVQIPEEDLAGVKAKVRAAWKKTHDQGEDMPSVLKADPTWRRILEAVGKKLGWGEADIEKMADEATTYAGVAAERDMWRIYSEVWNMTSDLSSAITNALRESDTPATDITTSLEQFTAAAKAAIASWTAGETVEPVAKVGRKMSADRLGRLTEARDSISALIAEAESGDGRDNTGGDDMGDVTKTPTGTAQGTPAPQPAASAAAGADGSESVEKRLETLQKQLEDATKRAETAESIAKAEQEKRELAEIRKTLTETMSHVPGMNAEEWAPVIRKLRQTAPDEAAKVETALKAASEAIRQSGIFAAIGGDGAGAGGGAYAKAEARAKELVEKGTVKTLAQGIAKVFEDDPQLYAEHTAEERRQH